MEENLAVSGGAKNQGPRGEVRVGVELWLHWSNTDQTKKPRRTFVV